MENMGKRIKIRVVKNSQENTLNEQTLNKPLYVGFTVLEISKYRKCTIFIITL